MDILSFKKANCKNCYKCIRECPVKAISFKGEQAQILQEDCVLCGKCLLVCPQNAKEARNDTDRVREFIRLGEKVVASVAPSFISEFGLSHISQLAECLKKLGFQEAEETATGAYLVTRQYQKLASEGKFPNIITTACPTIVKLVQKYHAQAVGFLAPVVSPMVAHGMLLKKIYGGDAKVVFIGPCLSKKDEITGGQNRAYIDCAITFDELQAWFEQEGIQADDSLPVQMGKDRMAARFFPKAGGILASMDAGCKGYEFVSVDGVERCRKVLEELVQSEKRGYFIEMSACEGSCVNGPGTRSSKNGGLASQSRVGAYARKVAGAERELPGFAAELDLSARYGASLSPRTMPSGKTITEILSKIGKTTPQDELNCGACGYSTCREKAVAVYFERAELEMCLPYMRDRAESISDKIINSTPNAIIALDDRLVIQQMNMAAKKLLDIDDSQEVKGQYIGRFTDPADFETVVATKENIINQKAYLSLFDKHVEQSILYIKQHHLVLGIMKDVTKDEKQYERIKEVKINTLETADKVIEKQMRVAQEIASLLGETTAETKIALTRLKNTIMLEE